MKILTLPEFLALPGEVLYAKYQPCNMGDLGIRVERCGERDFLNQQIADAIDCTDSGDFIDKLTQAEQGASISMDFDCSGRDGLFDDKQLFAVFEPDDVRALIARLQRVLGEQP